MDAIPEYSFRPMDAKKYGILAACILILIERSIELNAVNYDHYYNGTHWTLFHDETLFKHFWFVSKEEVKDSVQRLIDLSAVIKWELSPTLLGETDWYAIPRLFYREASNKSMEFFLKQ